jgi:hypothetical protein
MFIDKVLITYKLQDIKTSRTYIADELLFLMQFLCSKLDLLFKVNIPQDAV